MIHIVTFRYSTGICPEQAFSVNQIRRHLIKNGLMVLFRDAAGFSNPSGLAVKWRA